MKQILKRINRRISFSFYTVMLLLFLLTLAFVLALADLYWRIQLIEKF